MTTAPRTAAKDILPIVQAWTETYERIPRENPFVRYVQIFENKGSAMGCSNPHPHGQVWSLDYIPEEPRRELENMRAYACDVTNMGCAKDNAGRPSLLLTYAQLEMSLPSRPRVVESNDYFVAVVPWWAVWPFEVLLLPHRRQISSLSDMSEAERLALAELVGATTCRLDNVFECSFPYSMGLHQRPLSTAASSALGGDTSMSMGTTSAASPSSPPPSSRPRFGSRSSGPPPTPTPTSAAAAAPTPAQAAAAAAAAADEELEDLSSYAQFHMHFYPPLLRSATVRKFLVGFELMAEPQRDLTAEQAAARIRACDTVHYSARNSKAGARAEDEDTNAAPAPALATASSSST